MINLKGRKILVVAAHPDDEVVGAGATIARLCRDGQDVSLLILGEGPTSRRQPVTGMLQKIEWARLALGVQLNPMWSRFVDQEFDLRGQLVLNHAVEDVVKTVRPDVVFCHDGPTDLNLDHRIAHDATLVACRAASGVRAVLSFEVACSSEYACAERFRPSLYVQVAEEDWASKIAALGAYGELRDPPHPMSAAALRATAAHWGAVAGVPLAEAFRLLRGTL